MKSGRHIYNNYSPIKKPAYQVGRGDMRIDFQFRIVIAILLVTILTGACTPEYLSEQALMEYVRDPDHGLYQSQQRGSLEVSAIYRPTDLIVAQELRDGAHDAKEVEKARNNYQNNAYFILNLSHNGRDALYATAGSYQQFSDNLQKLSFRMPEYLYMTTSAKDTVELLDFHFSRMNGMSGSTQVLLAFKMEEIRNNDWIQLNLKEMGFGTGRVNLRFRMKDILHTPKIDFLNKEI